MTLTEALTLIRSHPSETQLAEAITAACAEARKTALDEAQAYAASSGTSGIAAARSA